MITGEDFAQETRDRILSNILPILIVVLIVAFVVGLAVAGLTIYTATVEKSREYGILKAEGFTNPYLYRVVFEQSMVTGVLGFLVGAGRYCLARAIRAGHGAAVCGLGALAGHPRHCRCHATDGPRRCLYSCSPLSPHRPCYGLQGLACGGWSAPHPATRCCQQDVPLRRLQHHCA